ncbi:hypothetical protein [Geminocystis herdmanii]|nr:hypothetical protein [Geminocystis herdmanii]
MKKEGANKFDRAACLWHRGFGIASFPRNDRIGKVRSSLEGGSIER